MEPQVTDRPEAGRFELAVDGEVVGVADYEDRSGARWFTHTWVEPAHRGAGLAGVLVGVALDEALAAGRQVVPQCSYVAALAEADPRWRALVGPPGPPGPPG
jgi:predicted GNAT family acetyltransferase